MAIAHLKGRIGRLVRRFALLPGLAMLAASLAAAQDKGSVNPEPLPPLANPNAPATPAKELFGRKTTPTSGAAHTIGFYSRGCIAGAKALPLDGETWQVMRQSRNRNWGHPSLVRFLERLAGQAPKLGWRGLLVGDMAQPRGGPMRNGHFSHQVGLDADIWLRPMPDRRLSREEREEMMSTVVVAQDGKDVDPNVWTPAHFAIIKAAAKDPEVSRIFANPAIKKALCREAGRDRAWLRKVRVWYGHDYHFHVRIYCPADSPACQPDAPIVGGEGCSGRDLDHWFSDAVLHPKPSPVPPREKPPLRMADLPAACRQVLLAP
ncbi:MAG TPA: penicillin-insensitive murein endopeptidase [Xanthobacteraceae bacterium]|jgi:penicillin-insensitive murein endopeptidase